MIISGRQHMPATVFFRNLQVPITYHPMSVIFVATDYSAISENAVQYGASLARQWGFELILLHSYFIPLTFNDPAIPIMPVDDLKRTAEDRMAQSLSSVRAAFPELQINARVEYGDIQDNLEDAAEELSPSLIIAGSHGADDADMWMGSTTINLLRNAKCPVLAVPPHAAFVPVKNICLALDLSKEDSDLPFTAINELQLISNTAVHLLHVVKVGEEATVSFENTPLAKRLRDEQVTVRQVETAGEIDDKIAEFAEEEGMQWLAVVPQHYSFWDSLFHKSHTKAVVKRSPIPVLALHG